MESYLRAPAYTCVTNFRKKPFPQRATNIPDFAKLPGALYDKSAKECKALYPDEIPMEICDGSRRRTCGRYKGVMTACKRKYSKIYNGNGHIYGACKECNTCPSQDICGWTIQHIYVKGKTCHISGVSTTNQYDCLFVCKEKSCVWHKNFELCYAEGYPTRCEQCPFILKCELPIAKWLDEDGFARTLEDIKSRFGNKEYKETKGTRKKILKSIKDRT